MKMAEQMRRVMQPLEGRIRLMLARAIVGLVNDGTLAQEMQVDLLEDEAQDGIERLQNYGFTSVPHAGAEAVVAFLGGLRSHGVALVVDDRRFRLRSLQAGEVALYDDLGNLVKLGREELRIEAVTKTVVAAPIVVIESEDIRLGGDGGAKVARVGDDVNLSTGKIISGSDTVTAL